MELIENIRRSIDRFYNGRIWNAVGAVLAAAATKILLASSFLDPSVAWAAGALVGICFYVNASAGAVLSAIAVFVAIAHISGIMSLVLAVLTFCILRSPTAIFAGLNGPDAFINGRQILCRERALI